MMWKDAAVSRQSNNETNCPTAGYFLMSCRDNYFQTARILRAPLTFLDVVPVDRNVVVPVRAGLFMVESQRVTCDKAIKLIEGHTNCAFYMATVFKLPLLHLTNYYKLYTLRLKQYQNNPIQRFLFFVNSV